MKKIFLCLLTVCLLFSMVACSSSNSKGNATNQETNSTNNSQSSTNTTPVTPDFKTANMKDLESILASSHGHIIVDVRDAEDYEEGHIPGAINIPYSTLRKEKPAELTSLTQRIFVYGERNNSRIFAHNLARFGYSNVYSCGDIRDWTGDLIVGKDPKNNTSPYVPGEGDISN